MHQALLLLSFSRVELLSPVAAVWQTVHSAFLYVLLCGYWQTTHLSHFPSWFLVVMGDNSDPAGSEDTCRWFWWSSCDIQQQGGRQSGLLWLLSGYPRSCRFPGVLSYPAFYATSGNLHLHSRCFLNTRLAQLAEWAMCLPCLSLFSFGLVYLTCSYQHFIMKSTNQRKIEIAQWALTPTA